MNKNSEKKPHQDTSYFDKKGSHHGDELPHEAKRSHGPAEKETIEISSQMPLRVRIVEYIITNQRFLALSAVVLLAIIGIAFYVVFQRTEISHERSQAAKILADELTLHEKISLQEPGATPSSDFNRKEALAKLQALVDKDSSLEILYDGLVAQEFIIDKETKSIDPYAGRSVEALQRAGLNRPAEFTSITRDSALNHDEKALKAAIELKNQLVNEERYVVVRLLNLCEIVELNYRAGKQEEAVKSYGDLIAYIDELKKASLSGYDQERKEALDRLLSDGANSYIRYLGQIVQKS